MHWCVWILSCNNPQDNSECALHWFTRREAGTLQVQSSGCLVELYFFLHPTSVFVHLQGFNSTFAADKDQCKARYAACGSGGYTWMTSLDRLRADWILKPQRYCLDFHRQDSYQPSWRVKPSTSHMEDIFISWINWKGALLLKAISAGPSHNPMGLRILWAGASLLS